MSIESVSRAGARVVVAALALACAKAPPPDPDAVPGSATPLEIGTSHSDSLECRKRDCADWYRLAVPGSGKLEVQLTQQPQDGASGRISVTLTDAEGAMLVRDDAAGRVHLTLRAPVQSGDYLVAVVSEDPVGAVRYSLTVGFAPNPPPPKRVAPPPTKPAPKPVPQVEIKRGEVLEVHDNGPSGRSVLLDLGAAQGMRIGLHGRLVSNGRALGTLEVVEVFPDGCIARVSAGAGEIGAGATAEIELR